MAGKLTAWEQAQEAREAESRAGTVESTAGGSTADDGPVGDVPSNDDVDRPPLGGAGSGRDAWADYAAVLGVEIDDDDTRDDIVAKIEAVHGTDDPDR